MNHEFEQKGKSNQYIKQAMQKTSLPEIPIYDFENAIPPMLTERMLHNQLEERQAKKQAVVVTVAAVATELILLLTMILLYEYVPAIALVGIGYVLVSIVAGVVTAMVYVERRCAG